MERDLDYRAIMLEIDGVLYANERSGYKMSRGEMEGQILAIIQKYDAIRKTKKVC